MTSRKKKQNADEKSLPKLTAAERTAAGNYLARLAAKPPRLEFKVSNEEGAWTVKVGHPDQDIGRALVMESIGALTTSSTLEL
jgi:hypothetical protein